jgi:ATP-binding cassette subfamily B protein/subfamily B ATP-binding cassette protein MsbA
MASPARFRPFLPYILRQWKWLIAIATLTLATSATAALQPWPIKVLVDYALRNDAVPAAILIPLQWVGPADASLTLILTAAAMSLALFLLNSALSVGLSISWNMAGQHMVYDLAGDIFARLQRLSMCFHSRRTVGDSLSRMMEDSWSIYSLADGLLMAPAQHVFTLTMMVVIGFFLDPTLAVLAVAVAPLLALSSWYFGPRLKRRSHLMREARARLVSMVHQTLGALPVVKAFGTEDRNTSEFRMLAAQSVNLEQSGSLTGGSYGLVNGLITTAGLALVLYVGGLRVLSGAIPLGTMLVFVAYVRQMQGATGGLFEVFTKLKTAQASLERLQDILHSDDLVHESDNAIDLPMHINSGVEVRFENVTFGYDRGRPVLENIDFCARPGEMIALVGPTGAGKSSLVSLIPRFFDPWEGRVNLNGIDVRTIKLSSLRQAVSLVLQEPFLLPMTVAENIAYGRPDASREEIVAAAVAVQADDFISRMPLGYDTVITESGANLSIGEQQRLAIARALLRDTPVLILDEPTSALDAQTELLLLNALETLTRGRTTFTIAHRMSTIRRADKIIVLDNGRIVAIGAHDELMATGGLYERFVRQQLTPDLVKLAI